MQIASKTNYLVPVAVLCGALAGMILATSQLVVGFERRLASLPLAAQWFVAVGYFAIATLTLAVASGIASYVLHRAIQDIAHTPTRIWRYVGFGVLTALACTAYAWLANEITASQVPIMLSFCFGIGVLLQAVRSA